ncbi:MAG: hypothetical protein ABEI52_01535, partial [Halobacteriaceae archaeon]
MATATIIAEMVHLFVAALWTGSVMFFGFYLVPIDGSAISEELIDRFMFLSRGSALVMFLSGGYLSSTFKESAFLNTG